jgi:hypothetical protein
MACYDVASKFCQALEHGEHAALYQFQLMRRDHAATAATCIQLLRTAPTPAAARAHLANARVHIEAGLPAAFFPPAPRTWRALVHIMCKEAPGFCGLCLPRPTQFIEFEVFPV